MVGCACVGVGVKSLGPDTCNALKGKVKLYLYWQRSLSFYLGG